MPIYEITRTDERDDYEEIVRAIVRAKNETEVRDMIEDRRFYGMKVDCSNVLISELSPDGKTQVLMTESRLY